MTISIQFTIPGVPQQQGSKTFNRATGFGYEANKNLAPWRKDAIACATEAKILVVGEDHADAIFTGPVQVTMVAYFPRPGAHYGSGRNAGVLKPSAPTWHMSAPDLDKLQRAVGDVLTQAQIVRDDRLIVSWDASKVYGQPRTVITVSTAAAMPLTVAMEDIHDDQAPLIEAQQ